MSQQKYIPTISCQITVKNVVKNWYPFERWVRKSRKTYHCPNDKPNAAWKQNFLFLLSNEEQEFLHLLGLSEVENNCIREPELSALTHLYVFFQASCYITALWEVKCGNTLVHLLTMTKGKYKMHIWSKKDVQFCKIVLTHGKKM